MLNINHKVINDHLAQIYREPDDISSQFLKYYYKVDTKFTLSKYDYFNIGAKVRISSIDVYCKLGDMSGNLAAMIKKELNNNKLTHEYINDILLAYAKRYREQETQFSFNNNLFLENTDNYQKKIISSLKDFLNSRVSNEVIVIEIFPVGYDSNEGLTQMVSHVLSFNLAIFLNLLSSNILGYENEGKKYSQLSTKYERSMKNRAACIGYHGTTCKACDLNFSDKYGDTGAGFIHIHHLYPLSEGDESRPLNPIKDLVPVCPNCHSMLHRGEKLLTIDKLKEVITLNKN